MKQLTDIKIKKLSNKGRHHDGLGLYLNVGKTQKKNWSFQYTCNSKKHELGLGPYPLVSLKDARNKRDELRSDLVKGIDPLEEKRKLEIIKIQSLSFKEIATQYIEEFKVQWKNPKHIQQWSNTLIKYAYPVIGNLKAEQIKTEHILTILKPIWTTKKETASRVRQRVERVMLYANAKNYYSGVNPASLRGKLEFLLPKQNNIPKHHTAMDFKDLPNFMTELTKHNVNSSLALQLLILTACRTSEVIKAEWHEINFTERVWIIPKERTKTSIIHRVPLSQAAISILYEMKLRQFSNYIFEGSINGKYLSDNAMLTFLKRNFPNIKAVPHGFRSTFRDWAETRGKYGYRAMELCLGHKIKSKTEAAYQRDDLLDQRKTIMNHWKKFTEKQ